MFASICPITTQMNSFHFEYFKSHFSNTVGLKKQLLIYMRGEIVKNKRFTGTHGEKGWMMGVIQDR